MLLVLLNRPFQSYIEVEKLTLNHCHLKRRKVIQSIMTNHSKTIKTINSLSLVNCK